MAMKALIIASILGFIASFERNDVKILQELGYEVHCACNSTNYTKTWKTEELYATGIIVHDIPFSRSPFSNVNIAAYKKLKKLMLSEHFDLIHCHTPVSGVIGRIVAHKCHVSKIFYTAHGFHFYTGAPIRNWLIYYPIEKWLSRYTDVLITINQEDYRRAASHLHAKCTKYVPGVGVDIQKFAPQSSGRKKIRAELEIPEDRILLLSVGELNENKNHGSVIKAVAGLDLTYVIVGKGEKADELQSLAQEVGSNVILTGYRSDVADFYDAADAYILPSIREGLNVSLMEAMASGLPCLCSRIRGNVDLIDEQGGYLFDPHDVSEMRSKIEEMINNQDCDKMGWYNHEKIKKFDNVTVEKAMFEAYGEV